MKREHPIIGTWASTEALGKALEELMASACELAVPRWLYDLNDRGKEIDRDSEELI